MQQNPTPNDNNPEFVSYPGFILDKFDSYGGRVALVGHVLF